MLATEGGTKEMSLIEKSLKLKAEAEELLHWIERHLISPDSNTGGNIERPILPKPFDEIDSNINGALSALGDIRELFTKEFVDRI